MSLGQGLRSVMQTLQEAGAGRLQKTEKQRENRLQEEGKSPTRKPPNSFV